MKKANNFQMANVKPQGVAYLLLSLSFSSFSLALLIKVLLIKKRVSYTDYTQPRPPCLFEI